MQMMQNVNLNTLPDFETLLKTIEDKKENSCSIQELETALALCNIEQSILILNFFKLLTHEKEDNISTDQANFFQHKLESITSNLSLEELKKLATSIRKIKPRKILIQKLELKREKLEKTLLKIQKQEEDLRKELDSLKNLEEKITKEIETLQAQLKDLSNKIKELDKNRKNLEKSLTFLEKEKESILRKIKEVQHKIDSDPTRIIYLVTKMLPNYISKKPKKKVNIIKLLYYLYKYKVITDSKKEIINKIDEIKNSTVS